MLFKSKSEFIKKFRSFNLNSLLPLSKVTTTADIEHYRKEKYYVGLTLEQFKSKFPNVDTDKVFYSNYIKYSQMVYYDRKKFMFFNLPIKQEHILCPLEEATSSIDKLIELYNQMYSEGDIAFLLRRCDSDIVLEVLVNGLEGLDDISDYYKLFISAYERSDFGCGDINKETFNRIISTKTEKEKELTSRKLKDFPKIITIYRGEGDESTSYSYSWTPDINVANFFATRLSQNTSRIIKATVKKENIIEYINSREEEFLIDPTNIVFQEEIKLISGKDKDLSNRIDNFLDIYFKYKNKLNNLIFEYDSNEHGKRHCLRVLFLSLVIANYRKVSKENIDLLCTAAIYHDIGRDNDFEDTYHGQKSYDIYVQNHHNNKILEFLMSYHCKDDDVAIRRFKKANFKNKKEVLELFCILKDADALDRVRFGIMDLDMNYLRLDVSKTLTLLSYETYKYLEL